MRNHIVFRVVSTMSSDCKSWHDGQLSVCGIGSKQQSSLIRSSNIQMKNSESARLDLQGKLLIEKIYKDLNGMVSLRPRTRNLVGIRFGRMMTSSLKWKKYCRNCRTLKCRRCWCRSRVLTFLALQMRWTHSQAFGCLPLGHQPLAVIINVESGSTATEAIEGVYGWRSWGRYTWIVSHVKSENYRNFPYSHRAYPRYM